MLRVLTRPATISMACAASWGRLRWVGELRCDALEVLAAVLANRTGRDVIFTGDRIPDLLARLKGSKGVS
jgi:hypothetical protein